MEITIVPLPAAQMKPKNSDASQLGFGKHFTDPFGWVSFVG